MRRALALAAGIALDARFGDPPTAVHPVGLIGAAARALHGRAPTIPAERMRYGLLVAAGLPLAAAALTAIARRAAAQLPLGGTLFDALALDATSALNTLLERAGEVERALRAGDLESARRLCARHLVSRDTSALDAGEVAGATIESVAENLSDAVIAPWLAFALAGAPGAAAYRAANTLDALWGYRDQEFALLGRAAARLDDALNLAPSRLTALAIAGAAALPRFRGDCNSLDAIACWRIDARRTASPNAGHPMAAMAGALGVRLTKDGAYVLGGEYRTPEAEDIGRAIRLARAAATLAAAGLFGALVMTGAD